MKNALHPHAASNPPSPLRRDLLAALGLTPIFNCAQGASPPSSTPLQPSSRRQLRVGIGHPFLKPSDAAAHAQDGDEVLIDAGVYEDGPVIWRGNQLLIQAVNGAATISASSGLAGLWQVAGRGITIRGILFGQSKAPVSTATGLSVRGADLSLERCGFIGLGAAIQVGAALSGEVQLRQCVIVRCGLAEQASISAGDVAALALHNCWIVANHAGPLISSASGNVLLEYCRLAQLSRGAYSPLIQCPFGELISLRACVVSNSSGADAEGVVMPLLALGDPLMQNRRFQRVELLHNTFIQRSGAGHLLSSRQALKALIGQANLMLGVDAFGQNPGEQTRVWADNLQLPSEGLPLASMDWRDGRLPQRFSSRAIRKSTDFLNSALDWRPRHDLPNADAPSDQAALTLQALVPSHRSLIGARQQFLPT